MHDRQRWRRLFGVCAVVAWLASGSPPFSRSLAGEVADPSGKRVTDAMVSTMEEVDEGEIPLGVTLPLTGEFESYGQSALTGILTRIRVQNAAGGISGKRIRPVVRDNRGKSEIAIDDIDLFTRNPARRVSVVLGPLLSESTDAVRRIAAERRVVVVSPYASLDFAPRDGGPVWVFHLGMNAKSQVRAMADFLIHSSGVTTAGILVDARFAASLEIGRLFLRAFTGAGGTITAVTVFRSGEGSQLAASLAADGWPIVASLESCLGILEQTAPKVVFIPCYAMQIVDIVHAVGKRPEFKDIRLCGPDLWDNQLVFDGAGMRILGSYYTSDMYDGRADYPPYLDFLDHIREAGVDAPDALSSCAYDAITLVLSAFEKGGLDAEAVRKTLLATRQMPLAGGDTSITDRGDAVKPVTLRMMGEKDGWINPEYVEWNPKPDVFTSPQATDSNGGDERDDGEAEAPDSETREES